VELLCKKTIKKDARKGRRESKLQEVTEGVMSEPRAPV